MNMSSLWMLTHAFRSIKAGWVFQLNADVTENAEVDALPAQLVNAEVDALPTQLV